MKPEEIHTLASTIWVSSTSVSVQAPGSSVMALPFSVKVWVLPAPLSAGVSLTGITVTVRVVVPGLEPAMPAPSEPLSLTV